MGWDCNRRQTNFKSCLVRSNINTIGQTTHYAYIGVMLRKITNQLLAIFFAQLSGFTRTNYT